MARTLSAYGDKLVPQLMRVIKNDGHDEALAMLLAALDKQDQGLLNRLAKDRHRKVREAAKEARRFV